MLTFEQHCLRKLNESNVIADTAFYQFIIIIKLIMSNEKVAIETRKQGTISILLILEIFIYFFNLALTGLGQEH